MASDGRGTKPLTSSAFYILLALADQTRHGLGIAGDVEQRTGGQVSFGPGTLYNGIKRLLADGLIAETGSPLVEGDDPRRIYYRITSKGRRKLQGEARRLQSVLDVARAKDVFGEAAAP